MVFIISSWVKYEVLPEAGHFLHLEAPEEVLRAVKELVAVPLAMPSTSVLE